VRFRVPLRAALDYEARMRYTLRVAGKPQYIQRRTVGEIETGLTRPWLVNKSSVCVGQLVLASASSTLDHRSARHDLIK
jgi:hypothetical protein